MSTKILLDVLSSGTWGTVGPHMMEAGTVLAEHLNMKHALITHSKTMALETLLRALEITCGDKVAVASYSDPIDSLTVAAVGAEPVFFDNIDEVNNVKAVISDGPINLANKDVILILNAGSDLKLDYSNAHAVVYDLDPYIGKGGAVVTNDWDCYCGAYAYHTCGRIIGGSSTTLQFDKIIGGDFRITEWHACLLKDALEKDVEIKPREFKNMKNQPFFSSSYFKKLTGR